MLAQFHHDEHGQDLIEYSLLLAFVVMCAIGMFVGVRTSTSGIFSTANVDLTSAKSAAS